MTSRLLRPFFTQVRNFPKSGKSNRAARLRFTPAESWEEKNLYYRSRAGKAHFNLNKTSNRLKRLGRPALLSKADRRRVEKLLRP